MQHALGSRHCVPCHSDMPAMTMVEAVARLVDLPGWELFDHGRKLRRTVTFRNFLQAQSFAVAVGNLGEAENHHPDISYGWGYCTLVFYTHKIGGLHHNDYIMAAMVNALMQSPNAAVTPAA